MNQDKFDPCLPGQSCLASLADRRIAKGILPVRSDLNGWLAPVRLRILPLSCDYRHDQHDLAEIWGIYSLGARVHIP